MGEYHHRPAIPKKDREGSSYMEYGRAAFFEAEMWPGGGKIQTQMYGTRLPNIRNLRLQGLYQERTRDDGALIYVTSGGLEITVGDGVCLDVSGHSEPDYRIVAIYPYRFLTLEVERI